MSRHKSFIKEAYRRLFKHFGPQKWWPGESKFEIMIGAILTQNTNWGNVEKAIGNLKKAQVLSVEGMSTIPVKKLAALIRPAGYFNVKSRRLKNFMNFINEEYQGDLKKMYAEDGPNLREKLLNVNGIGPETADSILLYACDKPVFVVDTYTKRIFCRHNIVGKEADYHALQRVITDPIKEDTVIFNEYHALIVRLGKDFCKPTPRCEACPLNNLHYSMSNKCPHCHRSNIRSKGICADCRQSN